MTRFCHEHKRPRRVIVVYKNEIEEDTLCNFVWPIEHNEEENHSHSGIILNKPSHDSNISPGFISYIFNIFYKWLMFLLFTFYSVISVCSEIGTSFGNFLKNVEKDEISETDQNKPVCGNGKTENNCVLNKYCQTNGNEHHTCIASDFLKDEGTQTGDINSNCESRKNSSINFKQNTSRVLKDVSTQTHYSEVNYHKNINLQFSNEFLKNVRCKRRSERDTCQSHNTMKISHATSKKKSILCKECLLKVTGHNLSKQDLVTGRPILCYKCLVKVQRVDEHANKFKKTFQHNESSTQETDNDDGGGEDDRMSDRKCSCIDCNRRWLRENSYRAQKTYFSSSEQTINDHYTTNTESTEQEKEIIMYKRSYNKKPNSYKIKGKKYNKGVTLKWKQQPAYIGNIKNHNREFNETSLSDSDETEEGTSYNEQVPKGKKLQFPPQNFRLDQPQYINNETVTKTAQNKAPETNSLASVSRSSSQIHHSLVIQSLENKSKTPLICGSNHYQSSPPEYVQRFSSKTTNHWEPTLKSLLPVQLKSVSSSEHSSSTVFNGSSKIDTKSRTVHEFRPSPSSTVCSPTSVSHTQFRSTALFENASSSRSEQLKLSDYVTLMGCKSRNLNDYIPSLIPMSSAPIVSTISPEIDQNNPSPGFRKGEISTSVLKTGIPIKDSRLSSDLTEQLRSAQPNLINQMNQCQNGSTTTETVQRPAQSLAIPAGNVSVQRVLQAPEEIKHNENNTPHPDKTVFIQPSTLSKQSAFMALMSQMGRDHNAKMLPMPFERPLSDNNSRQTGMDAIQKCKYISTRPSRLEPKSEITDNIQPNCSFPSTQTDQNNNCDYSYCALSLDKVPDSPPQEVDQVKSPRDYFGLKY